MGRTELLELRSKVQAEVDTLRSQITNAKRRGTARRDFSDHNWLAAREAELQERGRLMLEIQNRLTSLKEQRRAESEAAPRPAAAAANAGAAGAGQWSEVEKLTFALWTQATAIQIAAANLDGPARVARCLAEARGWLAIRDAGKVPAGFTPEQVEFWNGVLAENGSDFLVAPTVTRSPET